ncbi:MAG: hypothetical protein Q8R40_01065 [bacterium]|nr:hypothetical protein [bacterium]
MKRAKILLLAVASLLILSSANVFANGSAWWSGLTIPQKKTAVINKALSYALGSYGGECKEWVRSVVLSASRGSSESSGHVILPSTNPAPYDYYWLTDYSYHVAPQWGRQIEQVERGDIVQMHLTSGLPHTIIILYNDPVSGSIRFRESNVPYTTGLVSDRTRTYAQFKAMVTAYTIYWLM